MNTNQLLNQLKQEYFLIKPSEKQIEQSWADLENKLVTPQGSYQQKPRIWIFALVIFLLFLSSSLVIAAQNSQPGQPLYPLKQISAPIITAVSGQPIATASPKPSPMHDQIKSEVIEASPSAETDFEVDEKDKSENNEVQEQEGNENSLENKEKNYENEKLDETRGESNRSFNLESNKDEDEDIRFSQEKSITQNWKRFLENIDLNKNKSEQD
ncbi:hypothetical protein COX08_03450 [Candidatus Beckwithbacteria bacterium CG23_combo_of_CG06-09_8_20_14_all_34_8]|uniref:Uncharacterized protein n=1 Tax=Candidatus Beckwithbacteria bacterium CG23_combo_of_CG06-09_8_20_14_all_34_8 TaxID=1974497 RepID=A0A2H0B5S5_9BACT|nr:MAG: hypothetical protein COX08_03450 [Candidatus Beckwithbacteria bacterium CG23_combo_of_CG06-09_8_20_14_all_34_8]